MPELVSSPPIVWPNAPPRPDPLGHVVMQTVSALVQAVRSLPDALPESIGLFWTFPRRRRSVELHASVGRCAGWRAQFIPLPLRNLPTSPSHCISLVHMLAQFLPLHRALITSGAMRCVFHWSGEIAHR